MEQLTAFEWQVKEVAESLKQVGGCVFGKRLARHLHHRAILQRHSFLGQRSHAQGQCCCYVNNLPWQRSAHFMSLL